MPPADQQYEALVWTDTARLPLIERVLGRLGDVNVLAIGSPRRSDVDDLADSLGAAPADDLRKMLVDRPAKFLLLGSAGSLGADEVLWVLNQSTDVLTLEPLADRVDQALGWQKGKAPPGRLVHVPMFRLGPAYLAAADPQQTLGPIRSVSAAAVAPADDGSLFARLFDVVELLVSLLGLPDAVDASLIGPLADTPDDLRPLAGCLSAHLRYPGAAATLHVSDAARAWNRRLQIVASHGQLILDDRGYRLVTDDTDEADQPLADDQPVDPAELIARQWRWMIDHQHGPEPVDRRHVIAVCRTALLSCRTGQNESPQTLLKITA